MEQRSLIAYERWSDASSSFDQLVWGAMIALIAYLGESFEPRPWSLSPTSQHVEAASLLLLLAGTWFAFRRMEENVEALRMNHQLLHWGEARGELLKGIVANSGVGYNFETGEIIPHDEAVKQCDQLTSQMATLKPVLKSKDRASRRLYMLRNRAFACGLGLLVLSRLLPAA